jgi:hypothetical protein
MNSEMKCSGWTRVEATETQGFTRLRLRLGGVRCTTRPVSTGGRSPDLAVERAARRELPDPPGAAPFLQDVDWRIHRTPPPSSYQFGLGLLTIALELVW